MRNLILLCLLLSLGTSLSAQSRFQVKIPSFIHFNQRYSGVIRSGLGFDVRVGPQIVLGASYNYGPLRYGGSSQFIDLEARYFFKEAYNAFFIAPYYGYTKTKEIPKNNNFYNGTLNNIGIKLGYAKKVGKNFLITPLLGGALASKVLFKRQFGLPLFAGVEVGMLF